MYQWLWSHTCTNQYPHIFLSTYTLTKLLAWVAILQLALKFLKISTSEEFANQSTTRMNFFIAIFGYEGHKPWHTREKLGMAKFGHLFVCYLATLPHDSTAKSIIKRFRVRAKFLTREKKNKKWWSWEQSCCCCCCCQVWFHRSLLLVKLKFLFSTNDSKSIVVF